MCVASVPDRVTLTVPEYLVLDEAKAWHTRESYKIIMPDVSGIILSKNKVHENPFTGVLENNTDIPKSEIQHDLNKITIETRYKLLFSFLSIKRKKKYTK